MKKFLLLMTLFFALGFSAKAVEYEMNTKDQTYDTSVTNQLSWDFKSINFKALKNNGSTAPTYNSNNWDVRVYAKGTLQITANANITSIQFVLSAQGLRRQAPITASEGTVADQTQCSKSTTECTIDWTGNTKSVTFTVGDKSLYGSDGNTKGGQLCFKTILITTSDEGVAVLAPTFSVTESDVVLGTEVEINCKTDGVKIYYTTNGDEPTDASTLYEAPITIDEDMTIKAIAYKGADKSDVASASYAIMAEVNSLSAAKQVAHGKSLIYNGDLTVVYKNAPSVYVYDGTEFALIYGTVDCKAGDVIKGGWKATVDIYAGLFEMKPAGDITVDGTAEIPAPIEITADNAATTYVPANVSAYCLVKNVTFTAATPAEVNNITATVGEKSIVFRNNFKLASVEAGTYDVLGFIAIYDAKKNVISTNESKMQFFPIEYTEVKSDGIDGIEADTNAPVQYFNLSGMRIDNPAPGQTVIRLQAGKATKVRF